MIPAHQDNRFIALACVLAAIGLASTQDAITKAMSGEYSAYETVILRCLGSFPVLFAMLWRRGGFASLRTRLLPRILLRSGVLCVAYFAFVMSIAAMPIADAVAIYFTMPFFVAGLAGPLLGEQVRLHRWLAIAAAFIGVIIMARPGAAAFEPAALLALVSALGYAYGQMIGRPIAQQVSPLVMAIWQNAVYLTAGIAFAVVFNTIDTGTGLHRSLAFLTRPWVWPPLGDALVLGSNGVLAAFAMVLFISAYKHAESNYVAPFEYSGMLWALAYGALLFGDYPDAYTGLGAAVVIIAGLLMIWRDRQLDRAMA